MSKKYKRPGYVAAYRRLRLKQVELNNGFGWVRTVFFFVFLGISPIILFQLLSYLMLKHM